MTSYPRTLHPAPYTLYTRHPTPCTLHPAPCTLRTVAIRCMLCNTHLFRRGSGGAVLSLSLKHTHARALALSLTRTRTLTHHPPTRSLSLYLSVSLSLSLSHARALCPPLSPSRSTPVQTRQRGRRPSSSSQPACPAPMPSCISHSASIKLF